MITNSLLSSLRQIVSPDYVISDEETMTLYSTDQSGLSESPGVVLLPGDEEQVSRVVRLLSEAEVPITIRGAGNGVTGGAVPLPGGAVIGMTRLNEPTEIDPDSAMVSAPAGARLLDAERLASQYDLRIGGPLPEYGHGTVGGAVARNGDGLGTRTGMLHGTVRSLRAVLADGSVLDTGAVDPSGQNLHGAGFLIGSEGGLGIVTRAHVRAVRRLPANRIVLAAFEDRLAAVEAASGMISAGVSPMLADVIDRATWTKTATWPAGEGSDAILLIWIGGLEADIDDEAAWVIGICRDFSSQRATVLDKDGFSLISHAWTDVLRANRITCNRVPIDLAVPMKLLPELLESIHQGAEEHGISVAGTIRAAQGVTALYVPVPRRNDEISIRASRFLEEIIDEVQEKQGLSMALHGVGSRFLDVLEMTHQQSDLEVFRTVQQVFVPSSSFAVTVVPPPPRERRNLTERKAREAGIGRLRDVLMKQMHQAVAENEAVQIQVPTAQVLSQILRTAAEHHMPVAIHDRPAQRPVDLSLLEMKRVIMLDADSRVIAVEGGTTLTSIQKSAREHGLWLPVSPLIDRGTTVSDYLAWYRADSHSLGYGPVMERVIGLEAVAGRGDLFSWGGLVQTQHAGIRLSELCVGARHRYAIITAAALRLEPMPGLRATVSSRYNTLEEVEAAVRRWLSVGDVDETQKCRPSAACVLVDVHRDSDSSQQISGVHAFVEFTGVRSSVERQARWARHIADEAGAIDLKESFDTATDEIWQGARKHFRQWPSSKKDGMLHVVIRTDGSNWAELVRKARHKVQVHGYNFRMLMDLGTGRIDMLIERGMVEPVPLVRALCDLVSRTDAMLEVWSSDMSGKWFGTISQPLETLRDDLKLNFDPAGVLPAGWGRKIVWAPTQHGETIGSGSASASEDG